VGLGPGAGGRGLLLAVVAAFVPDDGPVVVGMDETIERRRGAKIAAKGIYRDPVRLSTSHVVKASGLRWISMPVLAKVPCGRCVAVEATKRHHRSGVDVPKVHV
jgi:hypothetical protein